MTLNSMVLFTSKRGQPSSAEQERGSYHALYEATGKISTRLVSRCCGFDIHLV